MAAAVRECGRLVEKVSEVVREKLSFSAVEVDGMFGPEMSIHGSVICE